MNSHKAISQAIAEFLNAELDRCQQFAVELRQVNRSLSAEDARALLGEAADAIDTLVQVSLYYQEAERGN